MEVQTFLSSVTSTILREDILILSLIILSGIVLFVAFVLHFRVKKFTKGKDAKSLEDVITVALKKIEELEEFKKDAQAYFLNVEKRLRRSFQSIETTRFNAFKGTGSGGNQSFATAFLNENSDGVVFSSMYSHDKVSVFAKPIKKGDSEYSLTEEESKALDSAKKACAHNSQVSK